MRHKHVSLYVSDNCEECDQIMDYISNLDISFDVKNTTEDKCHLSELQEHDIYITPAVIIDNYYQIIGFNKDRINQILNV
ncbi:thioredoxin family protein [Gracilibacillus caseinilyticus]|uniref:Thioredoxin family protein n=1 Tax=Gracilibacillus caseinilyticus TaxID=2932256 RepID=A0ABY4EY04_9BACI|nr:thioredoxin family protein [Gracilibacillus caseinilyticus]UOQ49138.1 thioredoxin family protein [Gracilibacillus caseinilyticus]